MKARGWMAMVLVLAALAGCVPTEPTATPIESQAARAQESFKTILVSGKTDLRGTLDVAGAADFDSTLNVDGTATLSADATVAEGLTVGDGLAVSAQTAISVTNNATITPTGTYQPLESADTVTASLAASGYAAGTLLTLINTSNTTIVFTDTGTLKASGNVSLGQYDAALFWFDGTNWIQIGESDN